MTPRPETPAVEFDGVSFSYPGGPPVLERVSLRVEPGERLGILGPNGGGKSTLLALALGLLNPSSGTVRVGGQPPAQARRAGVLGAVLQRSGENDALPLSALEVVQLGASARASVWNPRRAEYRQRAAEAIRLVGGDHYASRLFRDLSGGQKQRVRIARALASGAQILALDEPLVGVDPAGQQRFSELMERLHAELGLTVLIVSHDVRAVAAGCDRIACLARTLHYHATPSGLTPQVLAEVFQHDVAAIFGDVHVHAHPAESCPHDHPTAPAEDT